MEIYEADQLNDAKRSDYLLTKTFIKYKKHCGGYLESTPDLQGKSSSLEYDTVFCNVFMRGYSHDI